MPQGGSALTTSEITLLPLVSTALRDMDSDLASHHILSQVDVPPQCVIVGDERHFYTILMNLLSNARDALLEVDDDGNRRISVGVTESPSGVTIAIHDTGVGIPDEVRAHIFEPFFSTKPSTGTGLGLGMAEKLIALYGGKIDFDSVPRSGTTFRISIPRGGAKAARPG